MTTSIDASTGNLQERLVHTRAIEATIWGMPAVSMAAFRASLPRDLGATYGDILYFSDVLQPRHEALTGNNQTPYVFVIFDLQAGAMVLEVPPAHPEVIFMGSAIDSWQVPLVDIGAAGEDAGIGGKYLFLPPGYSETPPDGYIVVPSETYYIHIALRPIATSKGTLADAVAYSQLLKRYPLTEASNPLANRYIDVFPHDLHTLPTYDVSFLRLLADTIEHEPVQEKDAVMMGMLKSIGIEKGKPFAPDAEQSARMTKAVEDARAIMADYLMNQATIPFWEGRQWMANKPENTFGYSYFGDGILDYDRRSGGFSYYATWAPKRLGEPGKIPASYYLKDFRDKTGNLFKGNSTYRLRVQNDVPTRDFWSVVVYGVETNAFIYNDQERVGLSSYDMSSMVVNEDGSVDIYVGPQAPRGLDSNWIPTAGKDFWLMFRFYGPQKELFEKVWRLNDVEEVL